MKSLAFADPGTSDTANSGLGFKIQRDANTETSSPAAIDDAARDALSASAAGTDPADIAGSYGTFSFDWDTATGMLEWTFDPDDTAITPLGQGETRWEKLTIFVTDSPTVTNPADSRDGPPVQVVVAINGANDAPTGANGSASLPNSSDAYNFTPGDFNSNQFMDEDTAHMAAGLHSIEIASLPTAGTLTLGGGAVTVGTRIAAADIPTLVYTPGDSFSTDSFTFFVSDGTANSAQAYTMNLSSSFPVVTAATAADAALGVAEADSDAGAQAGGILDYSDRSADGTMETDIATLLFKTRIASTTAADESEPTDAAVDATAATTGTAGALPADITGSYGTFSFEWVNEADDMTSSTQTSRLRWTYDLTHDNATVQGLKTRQVLYEKVRLLVNDQDTDPMTGGDGAPVTLLVTITGVNDAPTLAYATSEAMDGGESIPNIATTDPDPSGTLEFGDIDTDDGNGDLAISAGAAGATTEMGISMPALTDRFPGNALTATVDGTFGVFTLTRDNTDSSSDGTLTWSYNLDEGNSVVSVLPAGQTLHEKLFIRVGDGTDESAIREVHVQILSDAPPTLAYATDAATDGMLLIQHTDTSLETGGTINFGDTDDARAMLAFRRATTFEGATSTTEPAAAT